MPSILAPNMLNISKKDYDFFKRFYERGLESFGAVRRRV